MPDLLPVEDAAFLMRAYADASDHWVAYRTSAATPELGAAAGVMADALHVAADDPEFFATLRDLVAGASVGAGPVPPDPRTALEPFMVNRAGGPLLLADRVLSREPEVLVAAGMTPVHAVRLATDLARIVPPQAPMPVPAQMTGLEERIEGLAVQLDRVETTLRAIDTRGDPAAGDAPRHRGWARALRVTGRGLGAVAGLAAVAGNVAGAVASFGVLTGLGLGSVLVGAKALTDTVADVLAEEDEVPVAGRARAVRPRG